jgi:hypothetical protein
MQNLGNTYLINPSVGSGMSPNILLYSTEATLKITIFINGSLRKTISRATVGSQNLIETRQRTTANLKLNKYIFCPQATFPFNFFLKITAIISPNFNRLMCVAETLCFLSLEMYRPPFNYLTFY